MSLNKEKQGLQYIIPEYRQKAVFGEFSDTPNFGLHPDNSLSSFPLPIVRNTHNFTEVRTKCS
jgi:hypothetical protein